ncbi:MAG TPA: hypothetical protein VFD06_02295, partial [Candidatus Polarisedimenticolia bacterium]|nr:hypothetical protein [Candidatus Polarisedimenticolia bacterium]
MTRLQRRLRPGLPIAVLLLLPGAFLWGGRLQQRSSQDQDDPAGQAMEVWMARIAERLRGPETYSPPASFSPFGGPIEIRRLPAEAGRDLLLTSQGFVEWDAARDAVAARVPAALRLEPGTFHRSARGTLRAGLNYLRLSESAVAARGLDAVQAEVMEHARILGWLPERTLLVHVEPREVEALARAAAIDRSRALEPYQKVAPSLGLLPRLSRQEAENPDLLARLMFVPGLGGPAAIAAIERMPGVSEVIPDATQEDGAQLRIRHDRVADLARRDEVLAIE